jgi:hypothetical protein
LAFFGILGLRVSAFKAMHSFTGKGLGNIFGYILINSSGHPGFHPNAFRNVLSLRKKVNRTKTFEFVSLHKECKFGFEFPASAREK